VLVISWGREPHDLFEPAPEEFDGIEVGGVGRQEQEGTARFFDGHFQGRAFVDGGVVQHQHAALGQVPLGRCPWAGALGQVPLGRSGNTASCTNSVNRRAFHAPFFCHSARTPVGWAASGREKAPTTERFCPFWRGTRSSRRPPPTSQPQSRCRFKAKPHSSKNTSLSNGTCCTAAPNCARAASSRSPATRVFFKAGAHAPHGIVKRAARQKLPGALLPRLAHLRQGAVGVFLHQGP